MWLEKRGADGLDRRGEKTQKKFGLRGLLEAACSAPPDRSLAPGRSGNFSILGAVLEPHSRGVLVQTELESQECQWGLPAVCLGSEEGDHRMKRPSSDVRETSRDLFSA
jgi:hypothetical protein